MIKNDALYCITGSASAWTLSRFSLKGEETKVASFNNLRDLEFSKEGLIIERESTLFFTELSGKETIEIPFRMELFGNVKDDIALKRAGEIIIFDSKRFCDKLMLIKKSIPDLFSKSEKKNEKQTEKKRLFHQNL